MGVLFTKHGRRTENRERSSRPNFFNNINIFENNSTYENNNEEIPPIYTKKETNLLPDNELPPYEK